MWWLAWMALAQDPGFMDVRLGVPSDPAWEATALDAVSRQQTGMKFCKDKAHKRDPTIGGSLTATLAVGENGKVGAVTTEGDLDGGLTACLASQLRRVRTPGRSEPVEVLVQIAVEPLEAPAPPARFRILVGDKYGFIDRAGAVVIEPRFAGAADFSEGFGRVLSESSQGFIRPDGTWLVEPTYVRASDFHEGRAAVWTGEKVGYVDTQGAFHEHAWFGDMAGGRVLVQDNKGVFGFLDAEGNQVGKAYAWAQPYAEGLAVVSSTGELKGMIDADGAVVVAEHWHDLGAMAEGYAQAAGADDEGAYQGLIDRSGELVYRAPAGAVIGPVNGGLFALQTAEELTLGKPDGTLVTTVDDVRMAPNDGFSDERLAVQRTAGADIGRWGFLDPTGEWAVPAAYDDAGAFQDGLAMVRRGTRWGYIDPAGSEVWFQPQVTRPPAGALESVPGHYVVRWGAHGADIRADRLLHTAPDFEAAIRLARVTPGAEVIIQRDGVYGVFAWDSPVSLSNRTARAATDIVWLVEPDPVAAGAWPATWNIRESCASSDTAILDVLQQLQAALHQLEETTLSELETASLRRQVLDEADRLIPQVFEVEPGRTEKPMWRWVTPGKFRTQGE